MLKKKPLIAAMAAALVTGAMFGGAAHAVRISENNTGQVLMGELYMAQPAANGPYSSSRITVVNPSTTDAVKAKIVFRSRTHSDECKDLILYMTPGDVVTMDVRIGANGVEVFSDDDSILVERSTDPRNNFGLRFASQPDASGQRGFNTPTRGTAMVAPRTQPARDTCDAGHVEVYGAYAVGGTVTLPGGAQIVVRPTMSKFDLIRIFDTEKTLLNTATNNITNNPNHASLVLDPQNHADRVRLKGDITLNSANHSINMPMVALREGPNTRTAGVTTFTVSNPAYNVVVGDTAPETTMGLNMGVNGVDTINDISGAVTTNRLFNGYAKGATLGQVTFPTKYRYMFDADRYANLAATANVRFTPPFQATNNGSVVYSVDLYDLQENSAPATFGAVCVVSPCAAPAPTPANEINQEVNLLTIAGSTAWDPAAGWFRMNLVNRVGVDKFGFNWVANEGVPSVGVTIYSNGVTPTTSGYGRP